MYHGSKQVSDEILNPGLSDYSPLPPKQLAKLLGFGDNRGKKEGCQCLGMWASPSDSWSLRCEVEIQPLFGFCKIVIVSLNIGR